MKVDGLSARESENKQYEKPRKSGDSAIIRDTSLWHICCRDEDAEKRQTGLATSGETSRCKEHFGRGKKMPQTTFCEVVSKTLRSALKRVSPTYYSRCRPIEGIRYKHFSFNAAETTDVSILASYVLRNTALRKRFFTTPPNHAPPSSFGCFNSRAVVNKRNRGFRTHEFKRPTRRKYAGKR